MKSHELLTGEVIDLSGLTEADQKFLKQLSADAVRGADYFEILRCVKGPEAYPLRDGTITPAVARSTVYRVAHDIVDRVGIEHGYLLAPDVTLPAATGPGSELLSLTEAANLIDISRPATHQALKENRLHGQRVGNAWVVRRTDAEAFRRERESRGRGSPASAQGDAMAAKSFGG